MDCLTLSDCNEYGQYELGLIHQAAGYILKQKTNNRTHNLELLCPEWHTVAYQDHPEWCISKASEA